MARAKQKVNYIITDIYPEKTQEQHEEFMQNVLHYLIENNVLISSKPKA